MTPLISKHEVNKHGKYFSIVVTRGGINSRHFKTRTSGNTENRGVIGASDFKTRTEHTRKVLRTIVTGGGIDATDFKTRAEQARASS